MKYEDSDMLFDDCHVLEDLEHVMKMLEVEVEELANHSSSPKHQHHQQLPSDTVITSHRPAQFKGLEKAILSSIASLIWSTDPDLDTDRRVIAIITRLLCATSVYTRTVSLQHLLSLMDKERNVDGNDSTSHIRRNSLARILCEPAFVKTVLLFDGLDAADADSPPDISMGTRSHLQSLAANLLEILLEEAIDALNLLKSGVASGSSFSSLKEWSGLLLPLQLVVWGLGDDTDNLIVTTAFLDLLTVFKFLIQLHIPKPALNIFILHRMKCCW